MGTSDWIRIFQDVCEDAGEALQWGLPEPWVQTELYVRLRRMAAESDWAPFPQEVPYVTRYPHQLPRKREWRLQGAVKWVDLCLYPQKGRVWHWVECKVRHGAQGERVQRASEEAADAFCWDIVSLLGFLPEQTADEWKSPDVFTKAYWFEELLRPRAEGIKEGVHSFVAAFLHLGGGFTTEVWEKQALCRRIQGKMRARGQRDESLLQPLNFSISPLVDGRYTLVLCQWTQPTPGTVKK